MASTQPDVQGRELGCLFCCRRSTDCDSASIEPGASFRDQLDLDSMDFLNFVLAVHDRLGIDIPEADYPHLSTLDGAVADLAARLARTSVR